MKINSLLVLFFLGITSISAQSTWFKFVPGWQCNNTIIQNDTIYAFCPSSLTKESTVTMGFNLNKVDLGTLNFDISGDQSFKKFTVNSSIVNGFAESFGQMVLLQSKTKRLSWI